MDVACVVSTALIVRATVHTNYTYTDADVHNGLDLVLQIAGLTGGDLITPRLE